MFGRKLNWLRLRDISWIDLNLVSALQDFCLAICEIHFHDRERLTRRTGAKHCATLGCAKISDVAISHINPFQCARARVDQAKPPNAPFSKCADNFLGGFKGIGRQTEYPLRYAELCLHLANVFNRARFTGAINIPPSGSVRNKMQPAVRRPLWLEDRFARPAGD